MTACDLEKTFNFYTSVKFIGQVRFHIHVSILPSNSAKLSSV